jgi:hypothetical protein
VRALIGVDSLKVAQVPNDVILINDAVTAEHVPGIACDLEGLPAVVPLDEGDHLWG